MRRATLGSELQRNAEAGIDLPTVSPWTSCSDPSAGCRIEGLEELFRRSRIVVVVLTELAPCTVYFLFFDKLVRLHNTFFCNDRVAVMYAGRIIEIGSTDSVLSAPRHPYTASLMACVPRLGERSRRLMQINGMMPQLRAVLRLALSHISFGRRQIFHSARERALSQQTLPRIGSSISFWPAVALWASSPLLKFGGTGGWSCSSDRPNPHGFLDS